MGEVTGWAGELRDMLRHRAMVSLGQHDLLRYLDLPPGLTVLGVRAELDPSMVRVVVAGANLPEVPDGAAAPPLDGFLHTTCYRPTPTEDDPHPLVYRRFAWSQQTPQDREEEMLAYIYRLRHQIHELGGKPSPWPEAMKPRLVGLPDA